MPQQCLGGTSGDLCGIVRSPGDSNPLSPPSPNRNKVSEIVLSKLRFNAVSIFRCDVLLRLVPNIEPLK